MKEVLTLGLRISFSPLGHSKLCKKFSILKPLMMSERSLLARSQWVHLLVGTVSKEARHGEASYSKGLRQPVIDEHKGRGRKCEGEATTPKKRIQLKGGMSVRLIVPCPRPRRQDKQTSVIARISVFAHDEALIAHKDPLITIGIRLRPRWPVVPHLLAQIYPKPPMCAETYSQASLAAAPPAPPHPAPQLPYTRYRMTAVQMLL